MHLKEVAGTAKEQCHSCKVNISLMLRLDRLAADKLDKAEEKSAAVKSGDRKEIEDTYIYCDERRHVQQIEDSLL